MNKHLSRRKSPPSHGTSRGSPAGPISVVLPGSGPWCTMGHMRVAWEYPRYPRVPAESRWQTTGYRESPQDLAGNPPLNANYHGLLRIPVGMPSVTAGSRGSALFERGLSRKSHGDLWAPRLETVVFCRSSCDFQELIHGLPWVPAGNMALITNDRGKTMVKPGSTAGDRGFSWKFSGSPRVRVPAGHRGFHRALFL